MTFVNNISEPRNFATVQTRLFSAILLYLYAQFSIAELQAVTYIEWHGRFIELVAFPLRCDELTMGMMAIEANDILTNENADRLDNDNVKVYCWQRDDASIVLYRDSAILRLPEPVVKTELVDRPFPPD